MQQDKAILPMLCMAFFSVSINLGAAVSALYPGEFSQGLQRGLYHFGTAFAVSLVLLILLRDRKDGGAATGFQRPLAWLFCALGGLALGLHLTSASAASRALLDWVPAVGLGLCWPVLVALFFSTAPPRRKGLAFGLCMATGEMVWVALMPFLLLIQHEPPGSELAAHIHTYQGVIQAGIGFCLALCLAGGTGGGFRSAISAGHGATGQSASPAPLLALYALAIFFLMIFGVSCGLAFPKAMTRPDFSGGMHFAALVAWPLAGFLLDKGLRGFLTVLGGLCLTVLLILPLGLLPGESTAPILSCLLGAGRAATFLLLYALLDRALRKRPLLPLLASAGHSLYLAQPLGLLLARPLGKAPALILLTLAFLAAALALFRQLRNNRALWRLPRPAPAAPAGDPPDRAAESGALKRDAFVAAFALTNREAEVLAGLLGGLGIADLAGAMRISERTTRFHLTGLLKKTGLPNRQRLLLFYKAWKEE